MRLKKLEIRGFKTFADPTELEFTPGITAVVGPNGSGKSNISDAIAWVMGESNVRHLRATRTEDVIFSGSAKRKPVGLAEVTLTVDNSAGLLPVGFEEVTITRRAYRSGNSEYLINKVPCRLRDIYELFLDSGVGRGAYSMVTQGEIDRLLTGKPEDRREFLEEAAGVKKYRHRRLEAYRKLENTKNNLTHVDGIMRELQDQMEPLAEQAENAIRYRQLTERLREIEVGLLVQRVQRLDAGLKEWKHTEVSTAGQLAEADREIVRLAGREQGAAGLLRKAQEVLEAAHGQYSRTQSAAERLKLDLALAEARKKSADEGEQRLNEEIIRLEMRLASLREQSSGLDGEAEDASGRRAELEEQVSALQADAARLSAEVTERQAKLAQQEADARELAEDKAAQKSRLESAGVRRAELDRLIEASRERIAALAARRAERAAEQEAASKGAAAQEALVSSLGDQIDGLRKGLADTEDNLESALAAKDEAGRALVDRGSRIKMLKEMEAAREGYFAGVRAVLAAAKSGHLPDSYATVADILRVPADYEQAVEAALGSALQDIVAPGFEEARLAIEYLKKGSLGRATFLPMDRLGRPDVFTKERCRGARGILGSAYDLVGFDDYYEPAARMLLGRVLIAEDLPSGAEAARRLNGWGKIVTLDGELLVPSGAITGGSRLRKGAGLIERKRDIADLTAGLDKLTGEQELAAAAVQQIKGALGEANQKLKSLLSEAEDARVALARLIGARDSAAATIREMEESERDAAARLESAKAQQAELEVEAAALEEMLTGSSNAGGQIDRLLERQRRDVVQLQARRDGTAAQLAEASAGLSAIVERENAVRQREAMLREETARATSSLAGRRRDLEQLLDPTDKDELSLDDLGANAARAAEEFAEARKLLEQRQAEAQSASSAHDRLAEELTELRETRELLNDELHKAQIALTRCESEFAQSIERLWDDYEITREDALTWPESLVVKHGTATEVARLRKEIRAMGDVNTGAVAEFERVRERWEFLASQRTDLEEARDSLLQAIREIDDSTRDLFMDTFWQVSRHFEEMFTTLFGGGLARLELTKPDDLLETGVEVIVQPPGKKLQNMELLSGGEKALTAQALLFALMRVKPSPFCVMDEVDAPLDDANVGRFAALVKQFAEDSQFIVITHNRATMEAADVLYGVTMSEPGISSVVSAELTDE